jgi:hypothetical protein
MPQAVSGLPLQHCRNPAITVALDQRISYDYHKDYFSVAPRWEPRISRGC